MEQQSIGFAFALVLTAGCGGARPDQPTAPPSAPPIEILQMTLHNDGPIAVELVIRVVVDDGCDPRTMQPANPPFQTGLVPCQLPVPHERVEMRDAAHRNLSYQDSVTDERGEARVLVSRAALDAATQPLTLVVRNQRADINLPRVTNSPGAATAGEDVDISIDPELLAEAEAMRRERNQRIAREEAARREADELARQRREGDDYASPSERAAYEDVPPAARASPQPRAPTRTPIRSIEDALARFREDRLARPRLAGQGPYPTPGETRGEVEFTFCVATLNARGYPFEGIEGSWFNCLSIGWEIRDHIRYVLESYGAANAFNEVPRAAWEACMAAMATAPPARVRSGSAFGDFCIPAARRALRRLERTSR